MEKNRFATYRMSLKTAGLIIAGITLLISMFFYAFAYNPTSTFYMQSGVYPGAAHWNVWREAGGTYYAKNMMGQIVYGPSANASYVIQSCLDEANTWGLASGTLSKVQLLTYVEITHTLTVREYTHLDFSQIRITQDVDGIIVLGDGTVGNQKITGLGLMFVEGYTHTALTLSNTVNAFVDIELMWAISGVGGAGSVGIELFADDASAWNNLYLGMIATADIGILINVTGDTSFSNVNYFFGGAVEYMSVGVWCVSNDGGTISGNVFYGMSIEAVGAGEYGFSFNGTWLMSGHNTLVTCTTIDSHEDAIDLNVGTNMTLKVLEGQFVGGNFSIDGTLELFNVRGYTTEGYGNATVSNGAGDITINHQLAGAPQVILVCPSWDTDGWYITSVTATQFVVDWDTNPGADEWLSWYANFNVNS